MMKLSQLAYNLIEIYFIYAKATNTKREIIKYGLIKIELNKNVDFLILGC